MMRRSVFAALLLVAAPASARPEDKLAFLIPNLFGNTGLVVDSEARLPTGQTHSAHFNSAFQAEFTQFNVALASQLTALPIPSPSSGFTYTLDPELGVFNRSSKSFGPLLSERAETVGKGKVSFGSHYQRFTFDTLEGLDLAGVPSVFTHDDPAAGGRDDVVATMNSITARIDQFTTYVNYGLTSAIDVAVAVPFIHSELDVTSVATVQRIGTTGNPAVHFFRDASGGFGNTRTFTSSGSASGVGDVVLRLKGRLASFGKGALGLGADVRFPTGDEEDLLGAGAFGVKPFLVLSSSHSSFAPHAAIGYQWNGDSTLAGDPVAGVKGKLPNQLTYSAGVALAVTGRATLALDLLGRHVSNASRLVPTTFTALDGRTTLPDIAFERRSANELAGAVSLKLNPWGRLLLDANVLFKLDDHGLRDTITPLVGLEYGF
jgi:hypothetical protein